MRPEAAPFFSSSLSLRCCGLRGSEQTRMACYRTVTDLHVEKSASGAGGAGAASGRVVSGAAAAGRSTAARDQTRVM